MTLPEKDGVARTSQDGKVATARQDGEAGFRRRSRDQDKTLKPGSGGAGIASSIRRSAFWCRPRRFAGRRLDLPVGVLVSPWVICRSASRCRPWRSASRCGPRRFAAWRLGVALGDLPLGVLVWPSASRCGPRRFAARRRQLWD